MLLKGLKAFSCNVSPSKILYRHFKETAANLSYFRCNNMYFTSIIRCFPAHFAYRKRVFPSHRKALLTSYRHNCNSANSEESEEESPDSEADIVNITFITHKGKEYKTKGKVGDNLLELAQKFNELAVDGACEKSLKCTTCHMYIEEDYFDRIEEASDQELDLLDTAKFLKPNSRLSCQIHLTKDLEGMRVHLPLGTVNFYVDGFKPTTH